jgi:phosphonate transport system substrate-binding protein
MSAQLKSRSCRAVLFCLAVLFVPQSGTAGDTVEPLRFGSVAMDTPGEMHNRVTPLTEYLSTALNRRVVLKLSTNMSGAIESVVNGSVDFAYLTPVAYVSAHARGNAKLVVKAMPEDQLRLAIVVREESPIRAIQDLEGSRFAFGDPAALLQRAVVVGAGMPLEKLGKYEFLKHYNNIVRAVLVGEYQAGVVMESTALKWKQSGLRIIHTSEDLPPYSIAANANVDDATIAKVRDALLRLNRNDAAHQRVIAALEETFGGFAPGSDADYDVVRRLIAPFTK